MLTDLNLFLQYTGILSFIVKTLSIIIFLFLLALFSVTDHGQLHLLRGGV